VLPEVGGGLCRIPFDDHAPSIAEVAFRLLVCPTLELSCEAPKSTGLRQLQLLVRRLRASRTRLLAVEDDYLVEPCAAGIHTRDLGREGLAVRRHLVRLLANLCSATLANGV